MNARKSNPGKPRANSAGRGRKALRAIIGGSKNWQRRPEGKMDRRESLMLLGIALLFVANVVIYLLHHWNLTGATGSVHAGQLLAPRVIVD